jgi:hypothetical protein
MFKAADLLAQGRTAVAEASDRGIALRMMGGIGILARCPSAESAPLARDYNDLDFFGLSRDSGALIKLFKELGYTAENRFNSLHGHRRLLFKTDEDQHVDVLLDHFEMCHKLDLRARLDIDAETLTLADLAITKLQVVEANDKDLTDTVALFADHDVSDNAEVIDAEYIATVCANDWGLHKTLTISLERMNQYVTALEGISRDTVVARLEKMAEQIEAAPKSRRWKVRARVGERAKWYELPEEV